MKKLLLLLILCTFSLSACCIVDDTSNKTNQTDILQSNMSLNQMIIEDIEQELNITCVGKLI